MSRFFASGAALAIVLALASFAFAENLKLTAEKTDEGVTIKAGDQLFTKYVIKSGAKPILWPLIGPTGKEMTRAYPMDDRRKDEKQDHIHHRSFWFTHGAVNGIDFWAENKGHGEIVHRNFKKVSDGQDVTIEAVNDWIGPDGKKVCEEERKFVFQATEDARWIDCELTIRASEGPVEFGDTKEGSFGVRVAESMKVEAGKGGEIVNSEGQKNGEAWGKRAAWVDYHGPVEGEKLGIAIMNHPSSFRAPTHWHVRTYGLFAANPFGIGDFTGSKDKAGEYTLPKGETMTLRYRVLLHKGDEKEGQVAEGYVEYAKGK